MYRIVLLGQHAYRLLSAMHNNNICDDGQCNVIMCIMNNTKCSENHSVTCPEHSSYALSAGVHDS